MSKKPKTTPEITEEVLTDLKAKSSKLSVDEVKYLFKKPKSVELDYYKKLRRDGQTVPELYQKLKAFVADVREEYENSLKVSPSGEEDFDI